jgi:ArsR family transcriptional regulator
MVLDMLSTVTATAQRLERNARVFHALSDETRLAILARLRNGPRCVCDLQDLLGAAQSRLSFHLRTLKDAGLVSDHKEGRWTYYALNAAAVAAVAAQLAELRPTAGTRDAGCC